MPSETVMHRYKHGTLRSGGKGKRHPKVKNRAQAVAVMMSERRKEQAGKGHGRKGRRAAKRR